MPNIPLCIPIPNILLCISIPNIPLCISIPNINLSVFQFLIFYSVFILNSIKTMLSTRLCADFCKKYICFIHSLRKERKENSIDKV